MKLSKRLKTKWLKALRSGEYGQTSEKLCNGYGSFCCLGVLEHIAMNGEVEYSHGEFLQFPSMKFYDYAGIEIDKKIAVGDWTADAIDDDASKLAEFNDQGKSFKWLANWIEKNIPTK